MRAAGPGLNRELSATRLSRASRFHALFRRGHRHRTTACRAEQEPPTLNAQENLGALTVDPLRLRQILLNLLSNACKFTKEGEVKLQARRMADGRARDQSFPVPRYRHRHDAEQQAKVFDEFTQADPTTAQRFVPYPKIIASA